MFDTQFSKIICKNIGIDCLWGWLLRRHFETLILQTSPIVLTYLSYPGKIIRPWNSICKVPAMDGQPPSLFNDWGLFVPAPKHNKIVYRVGPAVQKDYFQEYRNRPIGSVNLKGAPHFHRVSKIVKRYWPIYSIWAYHNHFILFAI